MNKNPFHALVARCIAVSEAVVLQIHIPFILKQQATALQAAGKRYEVRIPACNKLRGLEVYVINIYIHTLDSILVQGSRDMYACMYVRMLDKSTCAMQRSRPANACVWISIPF